MADRDELDVWVGGVYAGRLHRRDADVDFTYDQSYRAARTPALSVSMPKRQVHHDGNVAGRWIDNLLPDNDEVRQRWARHFGEGRADAFNLLRHMGADCAGAVQILPVTTLPDTDEGSEPVDEDMIEKRLRELRRDPADWSFADHGGRWSLGGAQGKFALAQRADGSWESPTGRAASTHIFKTGIASIPYVDMAEYVTMRTAGILGIPVAETTLRRFGTEIAVISRRFDRQMDANGHVRRVHQEDMCQALGLSRALKYESDGGPSAVTISDLLRSALDPRRLSAARKRFARALVFNWLIVGTDAHAKNYALVHNGPTVELAPLYDLTGLALVEEPEQVYHRGKLAMKLGGSYRVRDITEAHLARAADALGVEPDWMRDIADRYTEELPEAIEQAIEESDGLIPAKIADTMKALVAQRVGRVRKIITHSPNVGGDGREEIWVADHTRNGRAVKGYWRKRGPAPDV